MSDFPDFGEKEFTGVGYPTPVSIPEETVCRTLHIPADGAWQALVMGVLYTLTQPWNWQQFEGAITREEAAVRWQEMFEDVYETIDLGCPVSTVDTPYWDDSSDVDDEMPVDEQTWYGYVTDPASQPTELDFIEDATIWAFTGLIVLSLGAVGIAPALAFRTTSVRFVLSFKNGGTPGDIIRYFVDGYKIYEGVDTGDGSITDVPVVPDPSLEDHQIYATWEHAS